VISKKATSSPPSETLIATDIGIGIAKIEKLIYTLHKFYHWVDKMLTKTGIWGGELAPRFETRMSYTEKLIYTLNLKHQGGAI